MLDADGESLSEPVGWGGKTSSEIEEEISSRNDFSLQTSLELCGTARLKVSVNPENIFSV